MIVILFLSIFIFFDFQSNPILTTQAASGTFTEDFTTTTYMDGAETNVSGWGTGSIENSKKKPTIVGSISSSLIGDTLDVFIDGDYAYVTNQDEGLKIVNITDPTNPFINGSYDTPNIAQSVFVDGDYAFIADHHGDEFWVNFQVVNITNPTNPIFAGKCSTFDYARAVVVDGNYAYVANENSGLSVVDITDPSNPEQIGVRDTAGNSINLAVAGDYAYVADGANGLVVIDISNPTTPTNVTTYSTGISFATNIVVEGNYAYVIDLNNGLVVVNITDSTAPTYAGSWSKSGVSDTYIYGDYLYVTDITDGLSVLNITDPTSPALINTISLPGNATAIVIEGCYAYLTCLVGGFQVVRIADPTFLALVGSYNTPGLALAGAVSGDFAYVADAASGLQVLDISDPSSPTFAGSYSTPGASFNVFISGDYAYIADEYSGLQILNITNPSIPIFAGSYDTPDRAYGIFVSGNYAYVSDAITGVLIIDISDPSNPTLAGSYDTPGRAKNVYVSGDYAYVADLFEGMLVLNVSDPSAPTFAGSYLTPHQALDVVVSGDYAYVADQESGLQVLNIKDPTAPTSEGYYDTPSAAAVVSVSGDYAYVADQAGGLQVIDISDPSAPTLFDSYVTPSGYAYGLFVFGDYVFVADYDYGVHAIEVRKNKAIQFDSPCIAQSSMISTGSGTYTLLNANLTVTNYNPSDTTLTYYLSADNGNNWETITPGLEHVFVYSGNQLKWKAVLITSNVSVTPVIYDLSIDYSTVLDAPSLDTPSDGFITDDYTPTFTWYGINGESNYLFQLDTATSFTTPLLNLTLPSSSTSYTLSSPLAIDTYYWRVAGIDSEGDVGEFSSYRTLHIIQDTNAPVIDHPNDVSYELGTTGNSITWSPSDSNPDWYNITLNSILTSHDDPWTGGSIMLDIDGLPLGAYTIVCSVYDLEGLMISDTVNIEVVTTAPPAIDDIADFAYEEGTTGNSITWHPVDGNPNYYVVTRDGTVVDDGPWLGGDIAIDIDGLAYGVYSYVCTVNDTEGQEASDTVIVTITDSVSPNLNSPVDIIYEEGETGSTIIWIATDTNPATYIVYKDGTVYNSDTWTSGSSIIISVDGLVSKQYNFTIVVIDQAGNSAQDTVMVGVTATVPEFNHGIFFVIISVTVVFTFYFIKRRTHNKN